MQVKQHCERERSSNSRARSDRTLNIESEDIRSEISDSVWLRTDALSLTRLNQDRSIRASSSGDEAGLVCNISGVSA